MDFITIEHDIPVICRQVKSFPEGIKEAFIDLEKALPALHGRSFFGISYFDSAENIVYKAGVEVLPGEEISLVDSEKIIVMQGKYLGTVVRNFMQNIGDISNSFIELMKSPLWDNTTPCIEWYSSENSVTCMVRMKDQ